MPALEGRRRLGDGGFENRLHGIEEIINKGIDVDRFLEIAKSAKPLTALENSIFSPPAVNENSPKPKIGVALDEAFNFYYRDNIDLLEIAGAEIVYFSPVNDPPGLPEVDGLYIGGGYPELFATELEANETIRKAIKEASAEGMPIYAECGGLMYLTEKISTGVPRERHLSRCFHARVHLFNGRGGSSGPHNYGTDTGCQLQYRDLQGTAL